MYRCVGWWAEPWSKRTGLFLFCGRLFVFVLFRFGLFEWRADASAASVARGPPAETHTPPSPPPPPPVSLSSFFLLFFFFIFFIFFFVSFLLVRHFAIRICTSVDCSERPVNSVPFLFLSLSLSLKKKRTITRNRNEDDIDCLFWTRSLQKVDVLFPLLSDFCIAISTSIVGQKKTKQTRSTWTMGSLAGEDWVKNRSALFAVALTRPRIPSSERAPARNGRRRRLFQKSCETKRRTNTTGVGFRSIGFFISFFLSSVVFHSPE